MMGASRLAFRAELEDEPDHGPLDLLELDDGARPPVLTPREFLDELRAFLGLRPMPSEPRWERRRRRMKPGGCSTPYCRKPKLEGSTTCAGCAS